MGGGQSREREEKGVIIMCYAYYATDVAIALALCANLTLVVVLGRTVGVSLPHRARRLVEDCRRPGLRVA